MQSGTPRFTPFFLGVFPPGLSFAPISVRRILSYAHLPDETKADQAYLKTWLLKSESHLRCHGMGQTVF
jgi:hypothetical protein